MTDNQPNLDDLRNSIDDIDEKLLRLLNHRAEAARTVAERIFACRPASTDGAPPRAHFAPGRERQIVERLNGLNEGPLPEDAIVAIFHEIIGASRSVAAPLRIAVLGAQASFTHQAARERFGAGPVYLPERTIPDVFDSVARRRADVAVVPMVNSTEGSVSQTLDCLRSTELSILGELRCEVIHHLMAAEGVRLEHVRNVYSHPQALGQCRNWLQDHLHDAVTVASSSTSEAARVVAEKDDSAAIASSIAAEHFNLAILVRRIEDVTGNHTRFAVLGRGHTPSVEGAAHRTSLLFATANRAGALFDALGAFNEAAVNLTRLESRPALDAPWDYIFSADLDGHVDEPGVSDALKVLARRSARLKVLGSYPLEPVEVS